MLEALLLVAAAQVAAPPAPDGAKPSSDLLEFLGEWPDDSARLLDEPEDAASREKPKNMSATAGPRHDARQADETKPNP